MSSPTNTPTTTTKSPFHYIISSTDDWQQAQNSQTGQVWGIVPCPPPPFNTSDIQYRSTVWIECSHVLCTIAFAIALLLCFSGVQKVTFKGAFNSFIQILPCFRDLDHGATSNTRFVIYFTCTAIASLIALLSLVADAHQAHKGVRIAMQIVQRLFGGAGAVLLTIALNHQREHRHVDALHGDIGIVQLVGQIRRINYSVVVIYTLYMIAELATSFFNQTHELRIAMASVSFVIMIILNLPIVAAATWIAFHRGHVAPNQTARVCLMLGVVLRFLGTIDASFWNKLALHNWVEQDPCPIANNLAFFNIMQILDIIGQFLLFFFVVSEFKRSRSIVTQESSLLAAAQYDDFADDRSSNHSSGDLQGEDMRTNSNFRFER